MQKQNTGRLALLVNGVVMAKNFTKCREKAIKQTKANAMLQNFEPKQQDQLVTMREFAKISGLSYENIRLLKFKYSSFPEPDSKTKGCAYKFSLFALKDWFNHHKDKLASTKKTGIEILPDDERKLVSLHDFSKIMGLKLTTLNSLKQNHSEHFPSAQPKSEKGKRTLFFKLSELKQFMNKYNQELKNRKSVVINIDKFDNELARQFIRQSKSTAGKKNEYT